MFLTHFPGALPAKCGVTQKPGNSSVLYRKTKNPFKPKICLYNGFKVLIKVETQKK